MSLRNLNNSHALVCDDVVRTCAHMTWGRFESMMRCTRWKIDECDRISIWKQPVRIGWLKVLRCDESNGAWESNRLCNRWPGGQTYRISAVHEMHRQKKSMQFIDFVESPRLIAPWSMSLSFIFVRSMFEPRAGMCYCIHAPSTMATIARPTINNEHTRNTWCVRLRNVQSPGWNGFSARLNVNHALTMDTFSRHNIQLTLSDN